MFLGDCEGVLAVFFVDAPAVLPADFEDLLVLADLVVDEVVEEVAVLVLPADCPAVLPCASCTAELTA